MKTEKQSYFIPIALLLASYGNIQAQSSLVNSGGAKIVIGAGTTLRANAVKNDGATTNIDNAGTLALTGDFNQISGATYTASGAGVFALAGTTLQTLSSDATLSIPRLTLDNTAGAKTTKPITVSTAMTITTGDFDLNGNNIDLGNTGVLTEDRTNNHIVIDNTANGDYAPGGGILFSNVTVSAASTEIRGTGLYLQRTAGSDYTVSVLRRCYQGATPSRGGKGAERIYRITGDPTGTNTIMRIYYASDEVTHVGSVAGFVLYRWQNATGWRQATDTGSGFANGTNGADYVEATNINGFSDWTIGSSATPLPISLLWLKGNRIEGSEEVSLTWATASETNNKGFDVEMSTDAQNFAKVAFVDGKGNSTTTSHYQATINNSNDAYYRLKQVDTDGTFTYSPVVFVEGTETLAIYPNPNKGTFTVAVGKVTNALPARLLNAQGQEVWNGNIKEARTEVRADLPSGIYFLHATVAGKVKITKIMIEK